MKPFASLVFAIIFASLWAVSALAQQASDPPFSFPNHIDVPGEKSDEGKYNEMVRRNNAPPPRFGPSPEPRVLKKGPLAPSDQDRASYTSFLSQPNAGLIRLLPQELNESKTSQTKRGLKTQRNGPYYSFSFFTHEYGYGSDLELNTTLRFYGSIELPPDHNISAGGFGGASYGMLTNLGDEPLEKITFNDPRAAFMLTYPPPRAEPDARCEFRRFRDGVSIGGQTYKRTLPIQLNATYLLRSINYGLSDVLVGFRVVREDSDGSVIIAWELLKQFAPRKLEKVVYVNPIDKCPIK